MKNKYFTALFMAVLVLCSQNLFAAETNDATLTDLSHLVAKINAKLDAGKNREADFADNLREFDALLAKHKDARPQDLAQVLLVEAQLYSQVFNNPEKALEIFERVKHDYPSVQIDGNTDEAIKSLKESVAKWKIRNALAAGTTFPDFTVKTADGKSLSLADYKGKVVLIDFWATWCPPCRAEIPNVVATYKKYHSQGFDIIGVSLDQNRQKLLSFTKENGMPWPQYFDGLGWENKLVGKYGIQVIPTTFLLNTNGVIIASDLRGEALEQAVAKALPKK